MLITHPHFGFPVLSHTGPYKPQFWCLTYCPPRVHLISSLRTSFYFTLSFSLLSMGAKGKTEDGSLKQKPWRNTACWLACRLIISSFSYTAQAHLPRNWSVHSSLNLPTSICNQEKNSYLWFHFLRYVKLTTKIGHQHKSTPPFQLDTQAYGWQTINFPFSFIPKILH